MTMTRSAGLDIVHVVVVSSTVTPFSRLSRRTTRARRASTAHRARWSLVEEQDRRIMQQGGGELRPHAWPSESWRRLVEQRLEPQHGNELVAPPAIPKGARPDRCRPAGRSHRPPEVHHSWLRWPNTHAERAT